MPDYKISRELCEEIYQRIQNNEKRATIYADYPFHPVTIRSALYRYGFLERRSSGMHGGNTRVKLVEALRENKRLIENGTITKRALAKKLNISYAYVCRLSKELGVKSFYNYREGVRTPNPGSKEKYEEILEHLVAHGGTVNSSIRATGIKADPGSVRRYAKTIGINIEHYRYAYQEYGKWKILPGPFEKIYTADCLVPALCTGCGTKHEVTIVNLRAGMSKSCRDCSYENTRRYRVTCKETGEMYKSVRKFIAEKFGLNRYTEIRTKLMKNSEINVDGNLYQVQAIPIS